MCDPKLSLRRLLNRQVDVRERAARSAHGDAIFDSLIEQMEDRFDDVRASVMRDPPPIDLSALTQYMVEMHPQSIFDTSHRFD